MSRKKLQQRVKSVASSTKSSSTAHAFTGSFSQSRARFNLQDHLPANPEQTQDTGAERYSLNAPPTFDTEFDEWNTQVQPGGPGVVGSPLQDNNLNNVHVNEEDEDFEEFILGATHQKRGQNYMLATWLHEHSRKYGEKILESEYIDITSTSCTDCGEGDALYMCRSCYSDARLCKSCVIKAHARLPTHRIWRWSDNCFESTSLTELGAVFHLGHGGCVCTNGNDGPLYVGDLNGFHSITVRYCRHSGADKDSHQLLAHKIFPCSDSSPSTAFTFNVLKQFHFLSNDSLLSAHRFYNTLLRFTNNAFPHLPHDRYREFLRAVREWAVIQSSKRSGYPTEVTTGSAVTWCPACPRPGVNYQAEDVKNDGDIFAYQLSYDGNFHLVRKNKSYDEHDTCISDGAKYFVHQGEYKTYLNYMKDSAYAQNTKDANCNNHTAAKNTWVKQTGLAETGVGTVICARHSFFMAGGTVNYYKGERFAYTDYAIANVLHLLRKEGAVRVGFFYDIYCHWVKNWWTRASQIPLPLGPVYPEHFLKIIGGIPKFHLAGHTDACYSKYSLNTIPGLGRLDAEGGERCWAHMNHAAGSTCEKGPGARVDALNNVMDHWNWCKCVEMVSYLTKRWITALDMAASQKELFVEYSSSLDPAVVRQWENVDTEPKLVNGKVESPFVLKETKESSIAFKLRSMLEEESVQVAAPGASFATAGSAEWLVDGLDIEGVQQRLVFDLKALGSSPTDTELLKIATRRKSLLQRLQSHKERAFAFIGHSLLDSLEESGDLVPGEPETYTLSLPSRFNAENLKAIREREKELRVVSMLKSLQLLCSLTCQKAHLLNSKSHTAKSQKTKTRSQSLVTRLNDRLQYERLRYQGSRRYLLRLGASDLEKARFQELRSDDIQGLVQFLSRKRELGQTNATLPWFWKVSFAEGEGFTPDEHYQENIKVEWFLARERYRRWDEEILWLKREVASTVLTFEHHQRNWSQRAAEAFERSRLGYWGYCNRQARLWCALRDDAAHRGCDVLKYVAQGRNLDICLRVLRDFSHV